MDFLTFKSFISIEALLFFYYIGAIVLPFVTWYFSIWLIRKYEMISIASKKATESFWKLLRTKQKSGFILFFIIAFLLMELFWRMLFEFLIAYMQMRDAIVGLSI